MKPIALGLAIVVAGAMLSCVSAAPARVPSPTLDGARRAGRILSREIGTAGSFQPGLLPLAVAACRDESVSAGFGDWSPCSREPAPPRRVLVIRPAPR